MTKYKIVTTKKFDEEFKKLDNSVKILILKYFKKLEHSENPRAYGKELSGNLSRLVRFRISNYRVITKIEDDKLVIYGLAVAHRSTIYNRLKL